MFKKGAFKIYTMKNFKLLHRLSIITLFTLLLIRPCYISHAATDDPGAGRLSGDHIPEEFYGQPGDNEISILSRYSAFKEQSPYTNKTYTHQDVFDGRTIVHGIDVSQWQGKNIDWQKVKAAGIDFAFIRVGYRGYGKAGTLNANTKDTCFDTNMKNAIDAGVQVGVYIFSQAITTKEAEEEADYILKYLGDYNVTMPLIMDYEYASDASNGGRIKTAKLSKTAATKICMAFCDRIAEAGYTPMVYANKSMLTDQLNAKTITDAGYRVWLAHYTTNTNYTGTFDFWQYASTGKVNGISGNVDMNFYYVQEGDNFVPNGIPIGNAAVSPVPNQGYTGQNITPAVTVTYEGQQLTLNKDYTVKYSNNKNLGTATIKVIGKGEYCGSKQITFQILPKTVAKVKAKKRSTTYITLTWTKDSKVTGYQIYRATAPDGKYKKIKTISKYKTITYKNTKLTKGQCYYYKVRSYAKSGGKTYYGAFSPIAAIYTKTGYTRNAAAKDGAVLYDTASTEGQVIANPIQDTSMAVTYATKDKNGKTWYKVTYKDADGTYTGFIQSGNVTITKVGKVTKTKIVNVRKSASIKSKKLTTLKKNKKVTVLSTKKKKGVTWYKVTFKKGSKQYTGWISAPYLKLV